MKPSLEQPQALYLDDISIVVNKPAGQLSVPGRGVLAEGSLAQQIQAQWADAKIVHRLDMATSGALLFARGARWQSEFSGMFARREIDKRYQALVHGRLGESVGAAGEIDMPLAADWPNRPRQMVDRDSGKPSLTRWQVLAHDAGGSWTRLALSPITGRSHQLRVHLLAIGHPIVGDALYGKLDPLPTASRLMLHAESIGFRHPLTGLAVSVASPVPF